MPRPSFVDLAGLALIGLVSAFLLVASVLPKLLGLPAATDALAAIGWSAGRAPLLGIVEVACVVLYAVPKTRVLGAVLLTGLLGGAIAAQLRVDAPLASHTLFGVYLGFAAWAGVWLTEPRLRALVPLRRTPAEG